eukprot:8529427-Ditylum_brightwellii.AAC.1
MWSARTKLAIILIKYKDKAADCDVIWLFENLKLAPAGIDSKSNKWGTHFYGGQLEGSSSSSNDKKKAIERFKAVLFLKQLDSARYGELLDSINEGSNLGRDEYPENLATAFDLTVKTSRQVTSSSSNCGGRCNTFRQETNKATIATSYRRQDISAR